MPDLDEWLPPHFGGAQKPAYSPAGLFYPKSLGFNALRQEAHGVLVKDPVASLKDSLDCDKYYYNASERMKA